MKKLLISIYLSIFCSICFAQNINISPLFHSNEIIQFEVSGNFSEAFNKAYAGIPDGIFPPVRVKDPFFGKLKYTSDQGELVQLDVKLKVRGQSSLQECAFPKIQITVFDDIQRKQSIFHKAKRVKIGTHCGDRPVDAPKGTIGRLVNEIATYRESFIYVLHKIFDMPSLLSRPTFIKWIDTTAGIPENKKTTIRMALVFENIKNLAKREGAQLMKDEVWDKEVLENYSDLEKMKMILFQAMIGNWDWQFPSGKSSYSHNLYILRGSDGVTRAVPYDFDLASIVTGRILRHYPKGYQPGKTNFYKNIYYLLDQRIKEFDRSIFEEIKSYFLTKEFVVKAAPESYPLDEDGRSNIQVHIEVFYQILRDI